MSDRVWHFCTAQDGSPVLRDGTPLIVGEWLEHSDPQICERGYHASRRPIDALRYAPGPWVSMCEVEGIVAEEPDKLVARRRKHLWVFDATAELREFARRCALDVIHLWEAPAIVREYLTTGDEDLREAARVAAGDAWDAAEAAVWDAARAAAEAADGDAAGDAAGESAGAAWAAARGAAWDAAGAAAGGAAGGAVWDAAWDAARGAQSARLEEMLLERADAKRWGRMS